MDPDSFHWLDVARIGEELAEAHPGRDPLAVSFPELKRLVEELEGFAEQHGHPANERILEAIQSAWLQERDELPALEEEDDHDDPRLKR